MKNILKYSSFMKLNCSQTVAVCLLFLVMLLETSCVPRVSQLGHFPNAKLISEVKQSKMTKQQVLEKLGSPSAVGTFEDNRWYYITRETEQVAFYEPVLTKSDIILIEFDGAGITKKVEKISNDAARDIEPVARITDTKGHNMSFLEQLFGNLGVAKPGTSE